MPFDVLTRNRYWDPPFIFPHDASHHAMDFTDFHLPLGRMHQAYLHDWGVARGLEVSGAAGDIEVVIQPGVAFPQDGRLIVLAPLGHGDIGANPIPPVGTPPQNLEVTPPVHLPLGGYPGQTVYVTIQYSEILRATQGSGGRLEQVPWLRLQPTAGAGAYVNDGVSVILAIVVVSAAGTLTDLKTSDGALPYRRRLVGETLEELHVVRSQKTGTQVAETPSATIGPGTGGGLELRVPGGGDSITLTRDGAQSFSSLLVRANSVTVKDSGGRDALGFNASNGELTIGSNGREGNLTVRDGLGRNALHFDANAAALYLGANGNEGDLSVRDASGVEAVRINGLAAAVESNHLNPHASQTIESSARFFRIHGWDLCLDGRSGGNKRALVDASNQLVINWANDYVNGVSTPGDLAVGGDLTTRGRLMACNPVRQIRAVELFADQGSDIQDIDLGSARPFLAYTTIVGMDPRAGFDRWDCFAVDIPFVDGNPTWTFIFNGDHFGPLGSTDNFRAPLMTGTGRVIRFRARSWDDASVFALGIVFFE